MIAHPFDDAAAGYDAQFTGSRLGRWLREVVWVYLAEAFQSGDHVLELGCGTGEDAVWLAQRGVKVVATDASPAMLEIASRKAEAAGVDGQVSFLQLDLLEIRNWRLEIGVVDDRISNLQSPISTFDGAFSNFGALNCLADRRPLAKALSRWVRPGGRMVLVVMGPLCPWEIAWHLIHGDVGTAIRRFRSGVAAQVSERETVRVWYPSARRLRAEFEPYFRHIGTAGIGALLPPSHLGHLVERWPRMFGALARWERRLGSVFPWTWLNDHYLITLERRQAEEESK